MCVIKCCVALFACPKIRGCVTKRLCQVVWSLLGWSVRVRVQNMTKRMCNMCGCVEEIERVWPFIIYLFFCRRVRREGV